MLPVIKCHWRLSFDCPYLPHGNPLYWPGPFPRFDRAIEVHSNHDLGAALVRIIEVNWLPRRIGNAKPDQNRAYTYVVDMVPSLTQQRPENAPVRNPVVRLPKLPRRERARFWLHRLDMRKWSSPYKWQCVWAPWWIEMFMYCKGMELNVTRIA